MKTLILLLLLSIQPLLASSEVSIRVRPNVTNERTNVVARVEPDPRNRMLYIEWYIEKGFESRTQFELEGEKAPITYTYQIKFTEKGDYTVQARLVRNDGSQKTDSTYVMVR